MLAFDKILHFGICFLLNFVISVVAPSQATTGVGFSVGLSIGKEVGDYFNPNSRGYAGDLLADGLGITAGVAVGLYANQLIFNGGSII